MLEQMRKGSKNVFVYFFFGILIIVFTFYFGQGGADGCSPSSRRLIATASGHDIYSSDLESMTNRVARRRNNETDDDFVKLQKQSADALSLIYVLSDEAMAKGFSATDAELRDFIMDEERNFDYQIYSQEGVFDPEIYQNFVVNGLLMTIENYQEFKRRELIVAKYMTVLENSVVVSPAQIDEINNARSTRVELEFVAFDPKGLEEALDFPAADIDAFLASNDAQARKYYDDHKKDYGDAKKVRVRRVMVKKAPAEAPEGDKRQADQKWAKVKDRILTKGDDFATVATEDSEDIVYGTKGGDMGFSELTDMNTDMVKVLEPMKPGEVKEYESDIARFLLKLEEVKEANYASFDSVKADIAKKLLIESKGKERLEVLAKELLAEAQKDPSKDLQAVVDTLKARNAPPTPEPPTEPGVEPTEEKPVAKTAWDFVRVASTGKFTREPRRSFKFDQDKGSIVPISLAWTDVPRIGDNKKVATAAFTLTTDKPLYTEVIAQDDKFFVARLKEREEPKAEELEKNKAAIEAELRSGIIAQSLGTWQVIFVRPDLELTEVSPYLAQVLEQAKEKGTIHMAPDAFPTTPEVKPEDKAAEVPAAEPAAGDKTAEKK